MYGRLDRATFALVALSIAPPAYAEGEPCFNDTDCPGSACGGDVCNWAKFAANPVGEKTFYCQPAGLAAPGTDGWCTTDANCKCRAQGAKCLGVYCSFTQAESTDPDPSVGGFTATGGSNHAGGRAAAGAPSSAGAATVLPPSEDDEAAPRPRLSRACNVGPAPANRDVTLALALLGVASAVARRRDRSRP
jgi:hypothetical protein